jgi:polyisoprenoid-binding protein YceI
MITRLARFILPLIAAAAVLAGPATIPAQETMLEMDPARTRVEFTLADVLHTVHGTFHLSHGVIRFNPATGSAGGEMVVDAASGESGSGARDGRMHRNVLQSALFPDIAFRPDRVEGKVASEGASEIQVHGVFAIHGAEHELTMPAEVRASGGEYTVVAHFSVPYAQWGMKNPSTLFLRVSDKVEITIHTVARTK